MSILNYARARNGKTVSAGLFASLILFPAVAVFSQSVTNPVAVPQGGVVSHGQVNIQGGGSAKAPVLNINQASARAVINWATFNVGSAATVNFNQPNAQSATLNRVQDL
ncbi:MAG: hypothetical protein ABI273_02400, partial [Lacunisphaera sp.]